MSVRAPNPLAGWQRAAHRAFFLFFFLDLALVCFRLTRPGLLFGTAGWPEGLLLVLAAATTLTSLSGQIPAQNAILSAVLIGVIGAAVEILGVITGVPFGPFAYNKENIGPFLFYPLPWAVPMLWVVAILNARGVARLCWRRYRHRPNYGVRVLGSTVALVFLLELSFEPYAVLIRDYWSWKPTKLPFTWYTAPFVNFLAWAVTSLLILLFVTPALINKSPVKRPPAYHPLFVWELLSSLFLLGTTLRALWFASAFIAAQMIIISILAVLGSRPAKQF
jgi:putative membrane protein